MKTVRIFISSPGDVAKERQRAREVVESLRRRYSRHFLLQPILWEDMPLQSDMPFQQGIETVLSEKGADIAIFILWSRLGSPLGHGIARPDGSPYGSGTEREYDLIVKARAASLEREGKARPDILVYTRRDDASFEETLRGTSTDKKDELIQQKKRLESFLAETFRDKETGQYLGAYFPFDRPVTFSQRLRTHLQDLLDQMAGESTDVIWDIDKQGPPFLGLEAFQPQHETIFFGREEEILEARHALKEQARDGCAFLLLSGASGSGKSSLARAGILPAICELEVDEQVAAWRSLILTPSQLGTDPIAGLVTSMAVEEILPALREGPSTLQDLTAGLRKDPELAFNLRIKDAFAKASARLDGSVRLLLVIDQLEELFTATSISAEDRSAFLTVIETFASSGSIWVLATVRSDFYQQVQSEPALVRMKSGHGQLDVLPPGPDALARVIEEPARLAGLSFEMRDGHSLSNRILKEAATHAELLPLVEFVLRELYENRSTSQQLTFAAYESLGGVEGALAERAEEAYSTLPSDAQESLASIMRALVTLGSGTEASHVGGEKFVRQRAPLADFDANPAAMRLVESFIAARLFTACQMDGTGEPAVTVAHESLLRVWPRAKAWADNNRDYLHTRARIAARMREGSPLLKGDPLLETAKAHMLTNGSGFTAAQREWIAQAVATATAKERKAARRRRLAFASLSLLTLAAIACAAWAVKRERDAIEAKKTAEELINNILYDLRNKLITIGRAELLDDVSRLAEKYFKANPPDSTSSEHNKATMWSNRGHVHLATSNLDAARDAYLKSLEIRERLAMVYPENPELQSAWGINLFNVAMVARFQGDLPAARHALQKSLEIFERLAKQAPQNVELQCDWGQSVNSLGFLTLDEANLVEARQAFQKALDIIERLAEAEPNNTRVQLCLGNTHTGIGDVSRAEGALDAARQAYKKSLEIFQRLAKADPQNAAAQVDLGKALNNLGKVAIDQGDLSAARQTYQQINEISKLLTADPYNAEAQFQWSVSIRLLGDALNAGGNLADARKTYEQATEMAERLSEAFPQNTLIQSDWSISLEKLGDVTKAEGDLAAARKAYQQSLEIRERLAKADPHDAEAQRGWSISINKLGILANSEGDIPAARQAYQKSLEIFEHLAKDDPQNTTVQRDCIGLLNNIIGAAHAEGDLLAATDACKKALEISERLAKADPRNAEDQRDLLLSYGRLAEILDLQKSSEAVDWWRRAHHQASSMKEQGILAPADEKYIEYTRSKIE